MSDQPPKQKAALSSMARPAPPRQRMADSEVPETATKPRRRYLAVPSWLVSGAVHTVSMLILALITGTLPEAASRVTTITVSQAEEEEAFEDLEFEFEPQELDELQSLALEFPDPGAISFGDVSVSAELASAGPAELDMPNSTLMDIGALFGTEGLGMSESGPGEGAAMFFGVRTKGRRIVYVVDNSNSMQGGKFETACAELLRSVEQLDESQRFYVIFFSDTAYPLFYPHTAKQLMPATEENKRRLQYWLDMVQRCLKTKGEEAMRLAFALKPDAIYILGDGAFTDNTVDKMLALPRLPVTVHTLGFRMKQEAEQDLRRIARKFGGTFTAIEVSPEMVALARKLNRPRNSAPNGPWGITLGQPANQPGGKKADKKKLGNKRGKR